MVPTVPLPRAADTRLLDTPSAAAEQLRLRGWTAQQVEYDPEVEPDPRLRVVPGSAVSAVELLLPLHPWSPPHWQAVRLAPGDRAVWSGPPASCPPGELVAFLESLLLQPEHELVSRYRRLG
jgi:hypothetical protein